MYDIGLRYEKNYLSVNEEKNIISEIENFRQNNPDLVAGYGNTNYDSIYFGERYKKNAIEFPPYIVNLYTKLMNDNFFNEIPFGVAINKYKKGQKIGAHIDKPISGPIVTIISLGSSSTMVFKQKKYDDIIQILENRSVVQMKDEIRNLWTHEILPVIDTRYSIIFRSLK